MEDMTDFRRQLSSRRPSDWEHLPDFPLYMDQVLSYMERQTVRLLHRHILQAVHREVDFACGERAVELLDEQSLATDLVQRAVKDLIARRFHRHELALAQTAHDLLRLHDRKAAVSAANFYHVISSSTRRMRRAAS